MELLMPAKSKKQQKFMAAVANNPKFAKKVGIPKTVGEEFMKSKKYNRGGMTVPAGGMGAMGGAPMGGAPMSEEEKRKRAMMAKMAAASAAGGGAAPAAPSMGMKKGGKVKKVSKGGKVRGCGIAKQGVRKAKMVKMKGA
tara:strand:+ start:16 stop:435 length:420 start_codon:yes stop_codon:yes gene_type:complete